MNSSKPLLSIIITAYNVAEYIEFSLHSAISQTNIDIEIIVVDDGSTDQTAEIVKRFSALDNRIKYYYHTNKGVSATRNFSLSVVNGIFFTFLDGDDLISKNFADIVLKNHESNDVLFFDFLEEQPSGSLIEKHFKMDIPERYEGDFKDNAFWIADKFPSLWAKAYRTEFIKKNNILFFDTKTLEDMFFILDILMLKPMMHYVPFMSYTYKYNNTSLSRKINISVLNDRQKVVAFYLSKYSTIGIPLNNYSFTFWFNRIFMQLYLVSSTRLISKDRKPAFFQTINFIQLLLGKLKSDKLVENNITIFKLLNTLQLKLFFLVYLVLFSTSKISNSFSYFSFQIFTLLFRIFVKK
jgi:glycosyltransferase involved in cell wall biosynthesis